ncbi:hypothetical protein CHELA20_50386 [Hyphomicrobiales bacterium]|nr:hypothetical protein CHELA20_50386 [Hyphomicrobiales bacterium]CAH1679859.1 hypothetical protein CHELA41_24740 [Hyphomicrobiales bacterium]
MVCRHARGQRGPSAVLFCVIDWDVEVPDRLMRSPSVFDIPAFHRLRGDRRLTFAIGLKDVVTNPSPGCRLNQNGSLAIGLAFLGDE